MQSFQNWPILKKIIVITLILAGLCFQSFISIRIWDARNNSYWEEQYRDLYSKSYHIGQKTYDFDDDNASFYIRQVESNINFSHYQEEWEDIQGGYPHQQDWDDHLVYSLSGAKYPAGVNITKLSEILTCRISHPNSTILADINYSNDPSSFSIYLNQSYITSPDNESESFFLYDMPPFQWSFPYPVYLISISMEYLMWCGNLCGYYWKDYYCFLVHENGDILVRVFQHGYHAGA